MQQFPQVLCTISGAAGVTVHVYLQTVHITELVGYLLQFSVFVPEKQRLQQKTLDFIAVQVLGKYRNNL